MNHTCDMLNILQKPLSPQSIYGMRPVLDSRYRCNPHLLQLSLAVVLLSSSSHGVSVRFDCACMVYALVTQPNAAIAQPNTRTTALCFDGLQFFVGD